MTVEEGDEVEANEKIDRALDDPNMNGDAVNNDGLSEKWIASALRWH